MIAILQARTGSKRFPKKVLKKIHGISILEHIINRLQYSKSIKKIVVATTIKKEDDVISILSKKKNISCFRGSNLNVLSRYIKCARFYKAENIIRLTADDPFVDPVLIDKMIQKFKKFNYDFVTNSPNKTYPLGLDVTIVKLKILEQIPKITKNKKHLEHVVTYLFENRNKYNYLYYDRKKDKNSNLRLTIDYPSDLKFAKEIYKNLYKKNKIFLYKNIINYMKIKNKKSL